MKGQIEKKMLGAVSKLAMNNAKKNANSACVFIGYQSQLPESVKNLRKF